MNEIRNIFYLTGTFYFFIIKKENVLFFYYKKKGKTLHNLKKKFVVFRQDALTTQTAANFVDFEMEILMSKTHCSG